MTDTMKKMYVGLVDATVETVYDPGSADAIIKFITLSNPGTAEATFTMSIGTDAVAVRIFSGLPVAAGAHLTIPVWLVVEDTDVVQASSSVDDVMVLGLFGVEVT